MFSILAIYRMIFKVGCSVQFNKLQPSVYYPMTSNLSASLNQVVARGLSHSGCVEHISVITLVELITSYLIFSDFIAACQVKTYSNLAALSKQSTTRYFVFIPGTAPWSGLNKKISLPPGPAASTIPSERPNFIFRGARLTKTKVNFPSSCSGL